MYKKFQYELDTRHPVSFQWYNSVLKMTLLYIFFLLVYTGVIMVTITIYLSFFSLIILLICGICVSMFTRMKNVESE